MGKITALLLLVLALLAPSATAQTFAGRGPWVPGPPDACSSLSFACAQIDDFNLTLRAAGQALWGDGLRYGLGGSLGATLSFYKSAEFGLSLPLAMIDGEERRAIYGPPELRLRVRIGPRMGPAPWGSAWPKSEPYPKSLPAVYDVRPARWTAALGLRFVPLWPGVRGEGPIACSASDTGCLAEVGLSLTGDLRVGPFLATAAIEATAAGAHSQLRAGGRLAANLFAIGALFAEGRFQHEIDHPAQRGGLALVGGQLGAFRGARLSAFYGLSFGGVSSEHLAGVQLDLPIGVLWGALQRLSELIDPFVGGDGWLYSDDCRPLFRLGSADGDRVWDDTRKAWIPVGTHLWRRGDRLYFDRDGTLPYGPVRRAQGTPPPLAQGYAEAPWPALRTASAQTPEGRDWLRRFALAPDPKRRSLCEQLMDSVAAGLRRAEEAPTLGDACDNARRMASAVREGADADARAHGHRSGGTVLAGMIAEAALCPPDRQRDMGISAAGRPPVMPAGRGRPGAAPGAGVSAAPPAKASPAPATPSPRPASPPGAGTATHAPPAVAPPPAAGAPAAPRAAPAAPVVRLPPSRQLAPGPQPRAALPPTRVRWVPERATMAPRARDYQGGAEGARMSVQGQDLAPALTYRNPAGAQRTVRFDGVDSNVMIDRKLGVATYPKTEAQALRQAEALRQNGMRGRWEVPSESTAAVARRLFTRLGIDVIDVVVVKP